VGPSFSVNLSPSNPYILSISLRFLIPHPANTAVLRGGGCGRGDSLLDWLAKGDVVFSVYDSNMLY
jgi:hypothetical protein